MKNRFIHKDGITYSPYPIYPNEVNGKIKKKIDFGEEVKTSLPHPNGKRVDIYFPNEKLKF